MLRRTGLALLLVALVLVAFLAIRTYPVLSQATRLDLTPDGGGATAGTAFSVTVTAYDNSSNVDTTYVGTIHFTSSDPAVTLPGDYAFQLSDNGTHIFTDAVTFLTSGTQTVTVTDGAALTDTATWSVSPASATRLEVTGSATMTAGATNELTITAKDLYGNTDTSYTGSKSLVFSGPTTAPGGQTPTVESVGIGSSTTVAFTSGVSNTSAATLIAYRAESTTVDVSDGTINSFGSTAYDLDLTVSPASAVRLEVTGTGTVTAGATNELTVTAKDSYGNTDTSYTGSKSLVFSGPTTAPGGQTPTVESVAVGSSTTVAFTSGVSNTGAATLIAYRAESTTVDVSDGTVNSFGSPTYDLDLTVSAASAARLEVTGSATVTAGATNELTVTARDSYSNTAASYTGSKSLVFSGPAVAPAGQTPSVESVGIGSATTVAFTSGISNAGIATLIAYRAESTTVDVSDGTVNSFGSPTYDLDLTVSPASAATLEVTGLATMTAGAANELTVSAKDSYGNTDPSYAGSKSLTFSGPAAASTGQTPSVESVSIGSATTVAFTSGISNAGAATLIAYRAESTTVDVSDGAINSFGSAAYDLDLIVTADSAASLDLTPNGGSTSAGSPFTVTVTAYDIYNNVATGYLGTVRFSSSDASAGLPSDHTFVPSDNGIHTFAATLLTSDSQTIAVTDTGNATLTNTETWTVGVAAIHHYTVTSASYSQTAGTPFVVTVTAYDSFGNVVTGDNTTSVTMTSTDSLTMLFDGNGNGAFDEASDNVMVLSSGTFNISARDTTARPSATITATDDGSKQGTSGAYTIVSAVIDHYTVTSASYNQTAGVSFVVTVTAYDSFGNLASTENATSVTMTSTSATMLFDSNSNGTFGEASDNVTLLSFGTFNISARDTTAGTSATITATDGNSKTGTSSAHTITAGAIDRYTVTSASYSQTAGVSFAVTVSAYDSFGNLVNTDNSTSVTMTSNSGTMLFDSNSNGTFGEASDNVTLLSSGTFNISARDTTAGTSTTITATDGNSRTGISSAYAISAEVTIDHYDVASATYTQRAGIPFAVTITAHDQFHNRVNNSSTSVTVTSSSGTMLFDSNGNGTFGEASDNITLLSSGTFTITARDTAAGSSATITVTDGDSNTGTSSTYTVTAGAIDHYAVTSDDYAQQVTVLFTVTVTAYDAFGNLVPADNVTVTMNSGLSSLAFDGNGNGTFGETGDNSGTLMAGTLDIPAKAGAAADGIVITATDVNAKTGISEPYSFGDFRCFIATAAYGTPMTDQIQVLRDFRDGYLMTNPAGRWFVSAYYRCSPPLARFIAHHDSLRAVVRVALTPIIWLTTLVMNTTLLQKMAILLPMVAAVSAAVLWLRGRRQSPVP
jgi:3-dehydroquinate dehydratase